MSKNKHLAKAKKLKNDEFYTQLQTVERELEHYKKHFKDKAIYCNCDNYKTSNFFTYFKDRFKDLGIKRLIATNYSDKGESYEVVYNGEDILVDLLEGNGDFRSEECVKLLKEVDIVVTNPPFSLFREYIAQLIEYDKDFIILGSLSAVTYIDIFPYIRDGKILAGVNFNVSEDFIVPIEYKEIVKTKLDSEDKLVSTISNVAWYTTLDHGVENKINLTEKYSENKYKKYDNYDAIEVSKVGQIPKDYKGVMGVPVNFLSNYNPKQFEILGSNRGRKQDPENYYGRSTYINGKETYKRIFIKRRT